MPSHPYLSDSSIPERKFGPLGYQDIRSILFRKRHPEGLDPSKEQPHVRDPFPALNTIGGTGYAATTRWAYRLLASVLAALQIYASIPTKQTNYVIPDLSTSSQVASLDHPNISSMVSEGSTNPSNIVNSDMHNPNKNSGLDSVIRQLRDRYTITNE